MQKVQLYIEGERLDLFKDETVSITQSIQNIKDISKIFTEFTQSFTVPASPTNNKIFKHYYNWNIVGGYDARIKSKASIELSYIPWKNGFIALNGVDLKSNKAYAYRITFYGETINLKDILGEDQLSDLSTLSSLNLNYTATDVKDKLQLDPTLSSSKIITPLITHTKRLYYDSTSSIAESGNLNYLSSSPTQGVEWSDLKYAIRIDEIITAIESHYTTANGFSSNIIFSDDFLVSTNTDYYNLYMWLHRKKGSVQPAVQATQYSSQVNKFSLTLGTPNTGMNNTSPNQTDGDTLSIYTQNISPPNAINTNYLYLTTSTSEDFEVVINRNGALFYSSGTINGTGSSVTTTLGQAQFGTLLPGSYTVSIVQLNQVNITFSTIKWEINGVASGVNWTDEYTATSFSTNTFTVPFNITEQIPEMKVIDFLTGLFKMFNLTAYVENGIIVVKTLNSYYQSQNTWDLTTTLWQNEDDTWNQAGSASSGSTQSIGSFTDTNSSQINVALPFKQINFQYKGLGTLLAKQYNQLNNKGWGTERYTLDSVTYDAPSEIYKVELPFEHVQYERILNGSTNTTVQYGFFVDQNQQSYFGEALLFYPVLQTVSDVLNERISFRDSTTTNLKLTSYIVPSNSVSLVSGSDTSNINFFNEVNEYTLTTDFTGTLFKSYYENYISEIFNTRRRIMNVNSYLPLNLIYSIKLYDTIVINSESFRINSMTTDLTDGRSKIELINIL
jgi:hypothetical protein